MIEVQKHYFAETAHAVGIRHPLFRMIGDTPLVPLPLLAPGRERVEIFAKVEWYNAGGSVKDRAAANMILQAIRTGQFQKRKILLDATSGNTGIAYAMLGAVLGIPVELFVPENVSPLKRNMLQAYGAKLRLTDPSQSTDGAILLARQLYEKHPDRYVYLDQYSNPANWLAHYHSTGMEILEQTQRRITHFVAGLGTTGTAVGTGRRLKEEKPDVEIIGVQPDFALHGIEGLKYLETAIVPAIYDPSVIDRHIFVSTEEARKMASFLTKRCGLLVGTSAAAAAVAARNIAQNLDEGTIVVIFPDGGIKYLEEKFWEEQWGN